MDKQFTSNYESRVVIYERQMFIRLATDVIGNLLPFLLILLVMSVKRSVPKACGKFILRSQYKLPYLFLFPV